MIKNLNNSVKNELPLHVAFTDTPAPKSLDKGYRKNTVNITGDYV